VVTLLRMMIATHLDALVMPTVIHINEEGGMNA
jgi:hypothetical protein